MLGRFPLRLPSTAHPGRKTPGVGGEGLKESAGGHRLSVAAWHGAGEQPSCWARALREELARPRSQAPWHAARAYLRGRGHGGRRSPLVRLGATTLSANLDVPWAQLPSGRASTGITSPLAVQTAGGSSQPSRWRSGACAWRRPLRACGAFRERQASGNRRGAKGCAWWPPGWASTDTRAARRCRAGDRGATRVKEARLIGGGDDSDVGGQGPGAAEVRGVAESSEQPRHGQGPQACDRREHGGQGMALDAPLDLQVQTSKARSE